MRTRGHAFLQMKRAKSSSQYGDNKDIDQNFSVCLSPRLESWVFLKLLLGELKKTAYPSNNYFSILHLSFLNFCVQFTWFLQLISTDLYSNDANMNFSAMFSQAL